jgi:hypothetical protein
MIPNELTESVLALPESERLELARRIVESIATERRVEESVADGVRRIEDVVSGKTRGFSDEEYRNAVCGRLTSIRPHGWQPFCAIALLSDFVPK